MYSGNGSGARSGGGSSLNPEEQDLEQAAAEDAAPPFSAGTYELLALLIATIGLLGLCNNLLVLVLYAKFKRLRSPTHLFLVNISLSDLLVSLFGVSFTFLSCLRSRWVWDDAACVWDGFSNSLFGIVSIMTLTVLAYERYIRVVHARVIDFSWSWRAITYIWLYSLLWTGAPLLGWNHYTLEIHGLGCSVDWRSKEPNDASFVLFFFLGCLAAPVVVMAYCYGHILYAIRMLRCVEDLQTVQVIKILRYEKKVAKMCFLMITTFLICWMPYAVVSLLIAYGYGHLITPTVAIIPSFFAKSSIAYNPVIYIFMSRKFRRCLLQLFCVHLLKYQRNLKDRPTIGSEKPIRPIVMSQKAGDRPKKKVTFSSSSIIFIITSDDKQPIDNGAKHAGTKVNVIQVKPL
ncbi:opsin-3 [Eublepharis macularius]|uniref:Opsin-3 n=1 Tax=Eublepharis macularius TaxID=481883 RepID=A0AA97LA02_EUBMA|nr:opsin-3 [Eublepharis macularius]